jgi:hypothetical protein
MAGITSSLDGSPVIVAFDLMRGHIPRLGQNGYKWEYAGVGAGDISNTRSNVTGYKAREGSIEAWIYADSYAELAAFEDLLVRMRFNDCVIQTQFGENRDIILSAVEANISQGRYSFSGVVRPFVLSLRLTVEATA